MENINKIKRQPTEWEEMFGNYVSDKGWTSKIYQEFMQVKSKTKQKH